MTEIETKDLLSYQYDVLGHGLVDNSHTEVRAFNGTTKQSFASSKEEFITSSLEGVQEQSDIYVGLNPRQTKSGSAKDVSYLTCLALDIDPIRPKGTGSSEEQLKHAINLGRRIRDEFSRGIVVSSGSGAHVYFPIAPIKVENHAELTKSIKNWMQLVQETYTSKELRIDSIFDLPRILRLWGSFNSKSKRICAPIEPISEIIRWNHSFTQIVGKKTQLTVSDLLEQRFSVLCNGNTRLGEIVLGNIKYPSRSECDFEFIQILARAHFSFDEIKLLVLRNPHGRKEECKDTDIRRIIDEKSFDNEHTNSYSLRNTSISYYDGLRNRSTGLSTGLKQLDEMISGLKPGKLYIIASRPNAGKTSIITQILTKLAEQGQTCLMYPTEVGSEPIFDKILAAKTGIYLKKFQNGTFTEDDHKKIELVRSSLSNLPLIVVEDFALTIDKIVKEAKTYAPNIIAIDFFQALSWEDHDSVGEKNDAVKRLKKLAIDTGCPIILASQLNRGDGKSDLRQLKGAGALEELGDVISYLLPGTELTHPIPYELNVMKSKYSATGYVRLLFNKSLGTFTEASNEVPF